MNYKPLTVGDIRQTGDEVRGRHGFTSKRQTGVPDQPVQFFPKSWQRTDLIGAAVLASDLMHLEFRRPE